MRYKFVELSVVTDETIEKAVNTWVAKGWQLDGIRFVVTDASRRPTMAFVSFVREDAEAEEHAAEEHAANTRGAAGPRSEPGELMAPDWANAVLHALPDEPPDDFPDPFGEVRMIDLEALESGSEPDGGAAGA